MTQPIPNAQQLMQALPELHARFLRDALPELQKDARIAGAAAGGSFLTGDMDVFSDLDLIIAIEPDAIDSVSGDREQIASTLGPLLAAFTGEHVGEPRLLICLYGPPLLHVDLKFVNVSELSDRVEDPVVLWDREGALARHLRDGAAAYPSPDLQWIEDRFWVWIHYGASKIGRGELFEACDFLSFLRAQVLGPMALLEQGARPSGVRRFETRAAIYSDRLRETIATHNALSCVLSTEAAIRMYRDLRSRLHDGELLERHQAEAAAIEYLSEIKRRLESVV